MSNIFSVTETCRNLHSQILSTGPILILLSYISNKQENMKLINLKNKYVLTPCLFRATGMFQIHPQTKLGYLNKFKKTVSRFRSRNNFKKKNLRHTLL